MTSEAARAKAKGFFTVCPTPDAQWFQDEALVPILADFFDAFAAEAVKQGELAILAQLRCFVTRHLCGTDTVVLNAPADCPNCELVLRAGRATRGIWS